MSRITYNPESVAIELPDGGTLVVGPERVSSALDRIDSLRVKPRTAHSSATGRAEALPVTPNRVVTVELPAAVEEGALATAGVRTVL